MIEFMSQLGLLPKSQLLADLLGLISSVLENTMKKTLLERFNEKHTIIMPSSCWMWTAGRDTGGYGLLRDGKIKKAHRVSYELHNGDIPEGLFVMHSCDTPACVNPAHLSLGTHADNMRDKMAKKRGNYLRGEMGRNVKLKAADVLGIRHMYTNGGTYRGMAPLFGISAGSIGDIVKRRTWKHI